MTACHNYSITKTIISTLLIAKLLSLLTQVNSFGNSKLQLKILKLQNTQKHVKTQNQLFLGWLDNFLPAKQGSDNEMDAIRKKEYPEQYPATYELQTVEESIHDKTKDMKLVRSLLKQTQLETRALQLVYDGNKHGWDAGTFHRRVDGKGACIVLAKTDNNNDRIGGYNPKGWSSLGGARPSIAAFLFYERKTSNSNRFQKLQKVGGGGLACANDDSNFGISFGPDSLVIPLLNDNNNSRKASSKLGPYFEKGPDELNSLFGNNQQCTLTSLQVFSGVYEHGEDIPYSGGVLDMTSG